ncbi:two-component system response regulator [Methylophaga sp. 42_8_T64]|nr:two-component system response regulator [Methylophaga sp. 42_8_T64]
MNIEQDILHANILIVDDQAPNVTLLEKMLKHAGYKNVKGITDSRIAVSMYLQHDVDLLLLDIRMPHMDGFEVMSTLQDIVSDDYLPILVLTAELAIETKAKALCNGAKDFLTKPFEQLEVLQRIHNILEVRVLHKHMKKQNQDLEAIVIRRTQELADSRYEIIQRLGRAAEYKDNETGNHILRMSKFSEMLAIAAGLSQAESDMILNASPMHDIGKIGIPDRVLLKPGKLDAEEWAIMQTHVTIGADLLSGSNSPLMLMAKNIALLHHEKWDGSGYPNGLAGENIAIEGRICALCDVFDALTSERPYKKAWTVEDTMTLIKEESGKHFDPTLVTCFESILDEVLAYRSEHMDELEFQVAGR